MRSPGVDPYERLSDGYDYRTRSRAMNVSELVRENLGGNTRDVVDLGVGTGLLWSTVGGKGPISANIVGLDVSMAMLNVAAASAPPYLRLVRGSINALPFRAAQFDLAIMAFVARECPNLVNVMNDIGFVLRDNARLLVVDYTDRCMAELAGAVLRFYEILGNPAGIDFDSRPYAYVSLDEVTRAGRQAGFMTDSVHRVQVVEAIGLEAIVGYITQSPPMGSDFFSLPVALRARVRKRLANDFRVSRFDRRLITEINCVLLTLRS